MTLAAVAALGVLNVGDVLSTRAVLARQGGYETNPLAGVLLGHGQLLWVKLAIVGLLALLAVRHRPRLGVMAGAWLVAGAYSTVLLSNVLTLVSAGHPGS